ncbi:MAG: bifunctional folylpolyglutamate synthase/dihydrofolate synthase [Clostridia bacterium]|nr:bifunctional folylpolyglutamate synthase/dihydrofolate synthase [Clostridia bacterium]
MSTRTYNDSFHQVVNLGLQRIDAILETLGRPERGLRHLHIAGTNGKGSVAAYLTAGLLAAGHRVGTFTSPSLVRTGERIRIDGEPLTDSMLDAYIARADAAAQGVQKSLGEMATPFEIWTAAAFLAFAEAGVDFVVLEVGLGGEFDATNVIDTCEAAVITRLDLDHTGYLGSTLADIARAKAGILKSGRPVFTLTQKKEAMEVIAAHAAARGCPMTVITPPAPAAHTGIYEIFDFNGMTALQVSLGGVFQIENACLAIAVLKALGLSEEQIRQGLLSARHPARLELLDAEPPLLFDGAHNPNGIAALCTALDRYYPNTERHFVFACMRDKDYLPSLAMLNRGKCKFYFTTVSGNERAESPAALVAAAERIGIKGCAVDRLSDAVSAAHTRGAVTVICGSLYLYHDLYDENYKRLF